MLRTPYARAWDSIVAPGAGFAIDFSILSGLRLYRRRLTASESNRSFVMRFRGFSDELLKRHIPSVDRLNVSCKSVWSRRMATTRDIVQGNLGRSMPLPT